MENTQELELKELKDLIEKKITCYDIKSYKNVSFILSKGQIEALNAIETNHRTIIRKDRQVGMSSLLNAIIACKMVGDKPISISFWSPRRDICNQSKDQLKDNIRDLTGTLELKLGFTTNNSEQIILSNGNSIKYHSIDSFNPHTSLRSCKYDWFIFDEAAYSDKSKLLYDEIIRRGDNPKITINSTQKGLDKFFFPIYFLGNKAGYKSVDFSYTKAHDGLIENVDKIKTWYPSSLYFMSQFRGAFIIDDIRESYYGNIIDLINPYILYCEGMSMANINKFIQENVYLTDKKKIKNKANNAIKDNEMEKLNEKLLDLLVERYEKEIKEKDTYIQELIEDNAILVKEVLNLNTILEKREEMKEDVCDDDTDYNGRDVDIHLIGVNGCIEPFSLRGEIVSDSYIFIKDGEHNNNLNQLRGKVFSNVLIDTHCEFIPYKLISIIKPTNTTIILRVELIKYGINNIKI